MTAPKPRPRRAVPDLVALVQRARDTLEVEGVVSVAGLGPPAIRAAVVEALSKQGFEVTKTRVRKPLRAQLVGALAAGAFIPLKSAGSHVVGASLTETKAAVLALIADGAARLVLRGTEQVMVPLATPVLSQRELRRVVELATLVNKVLRSKTELSLLRSDVSEAMAEVLPPKGAAAARAGAPSPSEAAGVAETRSTFGRLLSVVEATRDARTGLSFVPSIVAALQSELGSELTSATLLAAASEGLLELRPEGGIHRLSEAELALCPEGPHGTRLSWARLTAQGAS